MEGAWGHPIELAVQVAVVLERLLVEQGVSAPPIVPGQAGEVAARAGRPIVLLRAGEVAVKVRRPIAAEAGEALL